MDLKPLDSFDKGSTFLIVTKYTYFGQDVGMSPAVLVATNTGISEQVVTKTGVYLCSHISKIYFSKIRPFVPTFP